MSTSIVGRVKRAPFLQVLYFIALYCLILCFCLMLCYVLWFMFYGLWVYKRVEISIVVMGEDSDVIEYGRRRVELVV